MVVEQLNIHLQKMNLGAYLNLYSRLNSNELNTKWAKYELNTKSKNIKLQENTG